MSLTYSIVEGHLVESFHGVPHDAITLDVMHTGGNNEAYRVSLPRFENAERRADAVYALLTDNEGNLPTGDEKLDICYTVGLYSRTTEYEISFVDLFTLAQVWAYLIDVGAKTQNS